MIDGRLLELESGDLPHRAGRRADRDACAAEIAADERRPGVRPRPRRLLACPKADRYLVALPSAVQLSGIADRIGMSQTGPGRPVEDARPVLRDPTHEVDFQPIVELATGELARVRVPLPAGDAPTLQTRSARSSRRRSRPAGRSSSTRSSSGRHPRSDRQPRQDRRRARRAAAPSVAINFTPASLLDPAASRPSRSPRWSRRAGIDTAPDHPRVHRAAGGLRRRPADQRQVKALRRLGLRLRGRRRRGRLCQLHPDRRASAVDHQDRPRDRPRHRATNDAKQALVEAFVSFGRRIGAQLVAEGIETRRELAMLHSLGRRVRAGLPPRPAGRRAGPPPPHRDAHAGRLDQARGPRDGAGPAPRSA